MARPKDKRETILNSASDMFGCKGFHQTNINEIAENAGIGKGTVYEYFKSKNDLFLEVIKYNTDAYVTQLREQVDLDAHQTFEQKLRAFIATHFSMVEAHYKMTGAFINSLQTLNITLENGHEIMRIIQKTRLDVLEVLLGVLTIGANENRLHMKYPELTADLLYDMIGRITLRHFIRPEGEPPAPELEIEPLIDILLNGIGA